MDAAPGEWGDLDVEDVGERSLVLRLPRGLDVADEARVERVGDESPLGVLKGDAVDAGVLFGRGESSASVVAGPAEPIEKKER